MAMRALIGLGVVGLLLAGCGGSTTSTEASPSAVATSAAPSPVASDDACGLLSAEEINGVLGTTFESGTQNADDTRDIVTCNFTMTDDSTGVELPVSIVDVGTSLLDGQESYTTNQDLAPAYFGGDPKDVDVAGADKAYIVINEGTQSPVIGLLAQGRFILVQIGVEGATEQQAIELAQMAAARA